MERYLIATRLFDFNHLSLKDLVMNRGWAVLPEYERIVQTYDFVAYRSIFRRLKKHFADTRHIPSQTKSEVNNERPRGGYLWHKIISRNTYYRPT
jgi:hypothetical protein